MKRLSVDLGHPMAQLGLYALVALGLVTLLHALSADRIRANQRANLLHTLAELLPANSFDNELPEDMIRLQDDRLGRSEPLAIYRARRQGQPVAAILTTMAPDGYSGNITLLVAIRYDAVLSGVRVLEHHETPGLGDRLETSKSHWLLGFAGHSLDDPPEARWEVRRDGGAFDQFTGATVTPRAVVHAVRESLRVFRDRREELFAPSPPAPDQRS
ncbi:MAG: electron transport complex subunit RsxG [Methylococcus sp.]